MTYYKITINTCLKNIYIYYIFNKLMSNVNE